MARTCIIMPAYNAEAWIEASVRSVLDQTDRDLRLIVVNDGSTDGTEAVLARLAAEDERLTPLTVPNGGPARARNIALERLDEETEHVMFLDADDYLLPDALAYARRGAVRGADLTLFGFSIRGLDGQLRDYSEPAALLDRDAIGAALGRLYKANLLNQVWAKLISARLLREHAIRFPDYRWGEDRLFMFEVLEHCESLCVLPECKYRYVMHPGESLISRYYDKKFRVCLEIDERAQALCRRFGVKDDAPFRYMFLKSVFSCLTTLFTPGCPLDAAGRRAAAEEILASEQLRERSRGAEGGLPVKALAAVLRSGSPGLSLAVFHGVAALGKAAPELFRRIKHRK
ncbi:MAG: glycosyltransferase family 2 protein [Oscillospiraceae bacterium]|nr:glycosyltransferase family 2 protein [Oscillospiraceae bacterium]